MSGTKRLAYRWQPSWEINIWLSTTHFFLNVCGQFMVGINLESLQVDYRLPPTHQNYYPQLYSGHIAFEESTGELVNLLTNQVVKKLVKLKDDLQAHHRLYVATLDDNRFLRFYE